jgi:hypothetical protein
VLIITLLTTALGAILGFLGAAFYNHETCSTFAQALAGCSTVRLWPVMLVGGIFGAVVGFFGVALTAPPPSD